MELSSVAAAMAFRHSPIPSLSVSICSCSSASSSSSTAEKKTLKLGNSKPFSSARKSATLELQRASDLASALARVGDVLTVKDLNAALHCFGNSNDFNHISQLFIWMQENNKLDVSSYSHYVRFMANKLDAAAMLKLYDSIQVESAKDNVYVCNSVLRCITRKGKFDAAMKLFQQMKEDGLVPDVVTYSTLLAGCTKVKDGYPKALELIQELKLNKLRMDNVIYGGILAVCASNSKWEEAEHYFNQMKDEGHSPNVYHYSSLLNAYSACGDNEKADMLIQNMKSEGLVPNKVILTTLLKVYVKGGLFEKSRELLAELESLGYAEDEMPYCVLMDGLARAGHMDEAKIVFDEMMKKQVRSDGYAHSIMISALCRAKLFREAKQLAKDFGTTLNKYDLVILNSMLCAFCRAGEMESVMETLRKMDELAISPDYNTFHILIKYFCREKMYLLAYRTMEDMHSKGYQPVEELCSSLIDHLGQVNAYTEAFSVYNMLKYSKRTMCKALHEKILHILLAGKLLKDAYVVVKDNAKSISRPATKKFASAFMKSGNINLINDVMKTLHDCGHKIDQVLFEMAVSRYIEQPEKKDLLLHLLQWMTGQGYVVNSSTRNLILKNSHLFGRQLIAEVLSKQQAKLRAQKSQ
ncbi:pentatricopeptide repeat-containing protein At1g10910, chloroplastic isoform X2 [Lotus japonicus]|uniref:pentatricopeptide repeat-containing protein At1g10910, chloroplastic isoform X2 n=1 Tax=Lotus japonicus TaxID=34305 RepID=UPI002587DE28|nr:pentatricopeptide repeat-containing protein At1g10910, chloroplastic isoform X2 [Lotus japonicus]